MPPKTIAIDYDGTWTADPALWRSFVASAEARGHRVIIVTGRHGWTDDMTRGGIPPSVPIHYTAGALKETALRQQGITVDIWIDDMPGMIQDCRILPGSID